VRGPISWLAALALAPAARRARAAWRAPADADRAARRDLWPALAHTEATGGAPQFDALPLRTWDALAPFAARQRAGVSGALTHAPVRFWEPTSGSTDAPKHIPYTAALRASFTHAFAVWAHDALTRGPALRRGRVWFTVTPRFDTPAPGPDGVRVGSTDDREYLSGPIGWLSRPFLRSPAAAQAHTTPDAWRAAVAHFLCTERDLEVFSIWSPTLLLALLDWMEAHRDQLPAPARRCDWETLWPSLRWISAWDAGSAATSADALRRRLPQVPLQGKGLLATEGPMTVPLWGEDGGAPLLTAGVVLELRDVANGDLRPVWRAERGPTYEVVLSTPGGLPRLQMGDLVTVSGRVFETPLLRFLGRDRTVDLAGEKLTEAAAAAALATGGAPAGSALVAAGDHYRLEVDAPACPPDLAQRVDDALCAHHHYRLARALGQLGPVQSLATPGRATAALDAAAAWGGAKPSVLVAQKV
jgi:hypothetical protein